MVKYQFNNMKTLSISKSLKSGFTLVEIIISLAIFTVVALVAIGALLRVMDANRKSLSLKTAINNLNFSLESMSREMRLGSKYYLGTSIGSGISSSYAAFPTTGNLEYRTGDWFIAFTSSKTSNVGGTCNLIYVYRYNSTTKRLQKGQQSDCADTVTDSDFQDVTSPDLFITSAVINVDANSQPFALVLFNGYTGIKTKDKTEFSLQTRVSQRIK